MNASFYILCLNFKLYIYELTDAIRALALENAGKNWRAGSNNRSSVRNPCKYCPNGRSMVEKIFRLNHEITINYNDVEDIKTHISCWIKIFFQSTVLEKKVIYWLLWVSESPYHYKHNSRHFEKKKNKWFENLKITTPHPSGANRVVENV